MWTRARNWVTDKANAINPQAALFDQEDDNIATGLNNCVTKDGTNKPNTTMDWNNQRLTNLGAATAISDAVRLSQLQTSGAINVAGTIAGTDTITALLTPAISVYTTGLAVSFRPAATNTGAVTINLNSLGAKSIVKFAATALVAGDLVINETALIIYDGTNFQLINPNEITDGALSANVPLKNAANIFSLSQYLTASINGTLEAGLQNNSTGTAAYSWVYLHNGTNYGALRYTGVNWSGSVLTLGPSGEQLALYTSTTMPLVLGTNVTARIVIDGSGNFDFKAGTVTTADTSASEVGTRGAVRVTSSPGTGQCIAVSAGFTLNTGLAAGKGYSIYNDSASQITITQGSGLTLRLSGTSSTGNRTIEARGLATFWVNSTTEYIMTGAGVG